MTLAELLVLLGLRRPRRPAPDFPTRCPAMTFGRPDDPSQYTVYLAFEADLPPAEMAEVARGVWNFLLVVGGCALVTRRPDLYPAAYCSVTFGAPLGFTADDFPPSGAAAVAPARSLQANNDRWWHMDVWVDGAKIAPTVAARVAAVTHELAHVFGWPYTHQPAEHTVAWWELVRTGPPLAAANARKFRRAVA